jgi:hypothetical protein
LTPSLPAYRLARRLRPALLAGPPVYCADQDAVGILTVAGEWWLAPDVLRPALAWLPEPYRGELEEMCADACGRAA